MKFITTNDAPSAIGPYSQAVMADGKVYVSGQIALSPDTGELVGSDVRAQAIQCLHNLTAVLAAAGGGVSSVLKVTIFLLQMEDFAAVNAVYADWLGDHRPARATVAVAGLPRGALIEIECIACVT